MATDSTEEAINFLWGEEEDNDFDFLLPPKQVFTLPSPSSRVQKRALNKQAMERRSWLKFGDAANEDASSRLTMRSTEDIILERIRAPGNNAEETALSGESMSQLGGAGAVLMVCRLCHMRGDHWTARCPQNDLLSLMDQPLTAETSSSTVAGRDTGNATYVPPSMREGADRSGAGSDMRRRNDEGSVRVTNLSEDTREPDLMELFSPFGAVTRCYVAIDQRTSMSRGFGFVNFVSKEDARRAINNLNGYGYDNLILRVEWATPRPN